jgi:uncharacterized SAM-binding protein YcdF (DUF218 family)
MLRKIFPVETHNRASQLENKPFMRKPKYILHCVTNLIVIYFILNAVRIYHYSFNYSEDISDAAIVLGAGSGNGKISPVFRERVNHSIYLYNKNRVKAIILTGGYGANQKQSDSEVAKKYLLSQGIPEHIIYIEKKSKYTIENLIEAKHIMDSLRFKSALIVTDPLHMKRSVDLAKKLNINCQPSPTKTTMYRSLLPKTKSLMYETLFYSLGEITGKN